MNAQPNLDAYGRASRVLVPTALIVLILTAILLVGESRYRSCIARAEAEFPAVAVSAFTGNQTGPLKVSFVEERAQAVEDCGRL